MRQATPTDITRIIEVQRMADTSKSVVLHTLIVNPSAWYHISLNEMRVPRDLYAQADELAAQGKDLGYRIDTVIVPGYSEGGFFAMLRG